MTCIVAIKHKGKIYMGGDSAGCYPGTDRLVSLKTPKLFRNGEFLIGIENSLRMGQLLNFSFCPPKRPSKMSKDKFMSTSFMDAVRQCFRKGGYQSKNDEQEIGGNFIVGYQGNIYLAEGDYNIHTRRDSYATIGSGSEVALGALYVNQNHYDDPELRIREALSAAEKFNLTVRRPFIIKSI